MKKGAFYIVLCAFALVWLGGCGGDSVVAPPIPTPNKFLAAGTYFGVVDDVTGSRRSTLQIDFEESGIATDFAGTVNLGAAANCFKSGTFSGATSSFDTSTGIGRIEAVDFNLAKASIRFSLSGETLLITSGSKFEDKKGIACFLPRNSTLKKRLERE